MSAIARRREQNRQAQQRRRANLAAMEFKTLQIILEPDQWAELETLREKQKGPKADFFIRALMTGARFTANIGQSKNKLVKRKQ